jgi:hypothetical protein
MARSKSILALLITVILFAADSYAQNDEWTVYTTSNTGLPDNTIMSLALD